HRHHRLYARVEGRWLRRKCRQGNHRLCGQDYLRRAGAGCLILGTVRGAWPMNTRKKPILSAHGITNRFGAQKLHDDISFEVMEGEIFGIVGGSGAGKTVLLKTLLGLHRPNAGKVEFMGRAMDDLTPAEKASLIGVLFQQGALFSSLTVAQNIMFPL